MSTDLSQKELLKRIQQKDRLAVHTLYNSYFKSCSMVVLKDGGTMEDAREIFQEAIFSLIVKLQNPAFEIRTNLNGYLKQSCFNLWVSNKKKQRKLETIEQVQHEVVATSEVAEKEEQEELLILMNNCIKKASVECQQLLELSFHTKKKDDEIAKLMNYTKLFVRNKRRRCIKGLRKCMEA